MLYFVAVQASGPSYEFDSREIIGEIMLTARKIFNSLGLGVYKLHSHKMRLHYRDSLLETPVLWYVTMY